MFFLVNHVLHFLPIKLKNLHFLFLSCIFLPTKPTKLLRLTKNKDMPTKIYKRKRLSTRFSYALKPKTNLEFQHPCKTKYNIAPIFSYVLWETKHKTQISNQWTKPEIRNNKYPHNHITKNRTTHTTSSTKSWSLYRFSPWVLRCLDICGYC